MTRGQVTAVGQVGQRLRRGQDPVAGRERAHQGLDVLAVILDRHHATGAVVGGQNDGRDGQAVRRGHPAPAEARTTLATAEKSSRPYPASWAAVSIWRAVAVVAMGTRAAAA